MLSNKPITLSFIDWITSARTECTLNINKIIEERKEKRCKTTSSNEIHKLCILYMHNVQCIHKQTVPTINGKMLFKLS